jgi:hypothetical protein
MRDLLTSPFTALNLHESSAPPLSLPPHRHPHPPSHSHFIQHQLPPPPDRTTEVSFYPPSAPTDASLSSLSDPEPSSTSLSSSMIVSGLSFYDRTHARNVPDYQGSGWPATFDSSFSNTTGNSFTAHDSAFNPPSSSISSAASAGAQGFQFLSNPAELGVIGRVP